MRMDQFPGLTEEAQKFLRENGEPAIKCSHCDRAFPSRHVKIDQFEGMFGDYFPLWRCPLKDGGYADEFLQETQWSSGACHFIGLRIPSKDLTFAWTNEAVEAWL